LEETDEMEQEEEELVPEEDPATVVEEEEDIASYMKLIVESFMNTLQTL
jgi:hypothetical protein